MMRLARSWLMKPFEYMAAHKMFCFAASRRPTATLWPGALLVLMLWNAPAQAHGEAEWIRKMQLGCCGPADCARVPDGTWIRQGSGYLHTLTGEFITNADAKASIDEHYWECRSDNGNVRPVIAREGGMCLFVPAIGF